MRLFIILFLLVSINSYGQPVTVWELVQVKAGYKAEALYFYEHNWKIYREIAREKGVIQSYRLDQSAPDSAGNSELLLVTEYRDSLAYRESENNFRGILTLVRPDGPLLMNKVKPDEFRRTLFVKVTSALFRSPVQHEVMQNPGHQE